MSDSLPEDAWLNNFLPTPPRPLQQALQKRLRASTTHLNALAELYKQRAQIEAQYADSLAKLARTAEQGGLVPKAGIEWERYSGEAKLFDAVVSEIAETSSSHSTLAALLHTDFEQPLRELPNKIVAWRRIGEQDASLEKTLKDYEKTSAKLEKASTKAKSSKTDALSSELNHLTSSLSSLSPMVYTSYQRLDEERLRGLKEVIVRWGTVRAETAQRDGERAERSVAVLISWEAPEEVTAVGRKLGAIGGARGSGGNQAPTLTAASTTPQADRRASTATASTSNDFSPRPTPKQNGSSSNLSTGPPNSFAGGIKSMLGRRATLGPSRGRSGSNANSVRSGREKDGAFAAIGEGESRQAPKAFSPPVDEEGFSVAPADRHRNPWDETEPQNLATGSGLIDSHPDSKPATEAFGQGFSASPAGSAEALADSPTSQQPPQARLNLALASAPIQESEEERQAALQKMQQTLQLQPLQQPSRRQTIARGRRDVRNTMFGGTPDDRGPGGYGGLALGKIAGEEREEPSSNGPLGAEPSIVSDLGTNGNQVASGNPLVQRQQVSRQASSSSVKSNNPFDSPGIGGPSTAALTTDIAPGLRASLTETVNVITRGNQVQRVQINGEIYLSLRLGQSLPSIQGPVHIRVREFERLEKIAPNPAYLAQVPDKPGEYFLNAEVLATATPATASKGTLLFKYQVHVPSGQELSTIPLLLEPVFRCVDGETKMILHYRPNPESTLPIEALSNVSLHATFNPGPSVNNVQAKPAGGVWSPSIRRMTWNIEDFHSGGKIIAKFTTAAGETMSPLGGFASWAAEDYLSSGINLDVIKGELETDLSFEEIKRVVTAGKYMAEPVVS